MNKTDLFSIHNSLQKVLMLYAIHYNSWRKHFMPFCGGVSYYCAIVIETNHEMQYTYIITSSVENVSFVAWSIKIKCVSCVDVSRKNNSAR